MAKESHRTDKIFASLEAGGFPRKLQSSMLPSWITTEALQDDSIANEVATILAKRFGLRASLLFDQEPKVEALRRRDVKYKRSIPNQQTDLTIATSLAVTVSETIASACKVAFQPIPNLASRFRAEVFQQHNGNWLGLRNLLLTCWSHGIPVVNLSEMGDGFPKMDGMVIQTESRPVIVLSKNSPLWAWQLFVLAHEAAHISLGHVAAGEILIDEELGADSYALDDQDPDERAADAFALELINGRSEATYSASAETVNSKELAEAAFQFGKSAKVDPGHIALNFAHRSKKWGVGVAAAKILQGNNPPAATVINDAMWGGVDVEALPLDTVEFLERVTGTPPQASR